MGTPLQRFFAALNAEEDDFRITLQEDRLGLILRAAITELDWFYYNISRATDPTYDQQEQMMLLRFGAARLIKLALEARTAFEVPVLNVRRERALTLRVLDILGGLGMIEHGRRVAQTVASGVGRIEQVSDAEYSIVLPAVILDEDYYEREVADHYRSESRQYVSDLLQTSDGRKIWGEVQKKLDELVYPFAKHLIGYDADPLLDYYFFGLAAHEIQLYDGYDTFHFTKRFGGIPFQTYMLALTFVLSMYLRHERFAEALVSKAPTVKLENILTITSDTNGFIESLKDALTEFGSEYESFQPVTLEEARVIYEVLSCRRASTALLDRPGSPLPPMIEFSDTAFIRCLAGGGSTCVEFLLNSLRFRFPVDYNKHQQAREGSMQRAVQRVLNDAFDGLDYRENVKIRLGSQPVTDIDLVVLEKATGTVLLCQLKHQELFGADIHSRHLRSERLKEQAKTWLRSVEEWLRRTDDSRVRASLRLPSGFPKISPCRVILSRHFAFPLKHLRQSAEFVWANWNHFFNTIELVRKEKAEPRLTDLVEMFHRLEEQLKPMEHAAEPRSVWTIRNLRFTISQETSEDVGS